MRMDTKKGIKYSSQAVGQLCQVLHDTEINGSEFKIVEAYQVMGGSIPQEKKLSEIILKSDDPKLPTIQLLVSIGNEPNWMKMRQRELQVVFKQIETLEPIRKEGKQ